MSIRKYLSPEERAEFAAILDEARSLPAPGDRIDHVQRCVDDAEQARRPWASIAQREAAREGWAKALKARDDELLKVAVLSHDGEVLTKPRKVGTRKVDAATGEAHRQRSLLELMTWDELDAKLEHYVRSRRSYEELIAVVRRHLELRDLAPEASTPAQAADQLGVDLDAWLSGEAAA
jgi:hypothetical protein